MNDINTQAKNEGWELAFVIDQGSAIPYLKIFGIGISNREASALVYNKAKARSPLHMLALQTVMQSRTTKKD
jgi:hypothetical protein